MQEKTSKLILPEEIFEQHTIALGKTGSGKSSALRYLVEHLLDKDRRVIVVTAKADWWGLKLSADGKHAGYPVVIFGGEHADMPLHHLSGKTMAELLGTGKRSAVLQMRDFMPGERTQFWIDFAANLFRLLQGKLFLVIDEVHNFAPKGKVLDVKAGQMLHWSNKLASEARGLGITLIAASQRPAKVHNDFLTSCETLIAMRVTTSWDRDAVREWISGCGDEKVGKEVVDTLAQMKRGDAWAWSPEIEFGPQRVHFPMFSTYDSFKPQIAAAVAKLKGWADVNLDEVREKLATVVKEHEANDPAKLKAKIRELQIELAKKPGKTKEVRVADPRALEQAAARAARDTAAKFKTNITALESTIKRQSKTLADVAMLAAKAANVAPPKIEMPTITVRAADGSVPPGTVNPIPPRTIASAHARVHAESNGRISAPQMRILEALATFEAIGKSDTLPSSLVASWMGVKASTGGFKQYLRELRRAGMVSGTDAALTLTDEGRSAAPQIDRPASQEELLRGAGKAFGGTPEKILRAAHAAYPGSVSRESVAQQLGVKSSTGGFKQYLRELRAAGLVVLDGDEIKAADWLFIE